MEDNASLFSLSIVPNSKQHLFEAARWARFLAIVGFVFLGLLIVAGIVLSVTLSRFNNVIDDPAFRNSGYTTAMGAGAAVIYPIVAVIYFFPLLYLLRFANSTMAALNANDQAVLTGSFQNLKRFFRYVGILTIIGLGFLLLSVMVSLVGVSLMNR